MPGSSQSSVCGIGLGLRQGLAADLFASTLPELAFVEIHPENYLKRGGRFRVMLERARERWPVLTHGLTLGFGAVEPAPREYTASLRDFLDELDAPFHSEHLCFSGADGVMLHDLLPLPFRQDAIDTAVQRIRELRDTLQRPVAIENVSYYAHAGTPQLREVDFVLEVLERADAKLLLDVNNVFVNARNHGFDPHKYIERIPAERVVQLHVAGHSVRKDGLIIDSHGEAVREEVYALLEHALRRTGPRPVLLERDQNLPAFEALAHEVKRLHAIYQRATAPSELREVIPWR
ncbi:MAG TPA: DUF692 domain-containing protein [Polyangiales bacterium]|nr:DUF692 domain-containing protein [Polyangiales bacterium]